MTFSSTLSPGPNNIMCMTLGQNLGFKKTFKYISGVIIGYSIVLIIIAIFNRYIFENFPKVNNILKIVGISYLLYLAFKILYATFKKQDQQKEATLIEESKLFFTAMWFQFLNPKAILFGLSIFASYILPYYQSLNVLLFFVLFLTFVTVCSLIMWTACGKLLHNFIKNYEKVFNSVMAGLLIYSALMIL